MPRFRSQTTLARSLVSLASSAMRRFALPARLLRQLDFETEPPAWHAAGCDAQGDQRRSRRQGHQQGAFPRRRPRLSHGVPAVSKPTCSSVVCVQPAVCVQARVIVMNYLYVQFCF